MQHTCIAIVSDGRKKIEKKRNHQQSNGKKKRKKEKSSEPRVRLFFSRNFKSKNEPAFIGIRFVVCLGASAVLTMCNGIRRHFNWRSSNYANIETNTKEILPLLINAEGIWPTMSMSAWPTCSQSATTRQQLINIYTQCFQFIIDFFFLHLLLCAVDASPSSSIGIRRSVGFYCTHTVQVMAISPLIVAIYKIKKKKRKKNDWTQLSTDASFFFIALPLNDFQWCSSKGQRETSKKCAVMKQQRKMHFSISFFFFSFFAPFLSLSPVFCFAFDRCLAETDTCT